MREYLQKIKLQPLPHFSTQNVQTDILRLDLLHPIISGNKWFKLHYYLQDAIASGHRIIASFGGTYSNHIVALAYATNEMGLQSIGYIRGDIDTKLTPTLLQAEEYGMKLVFINREQYRNKHSIVQETNAADIYWIMEGGYGQYGAKGASTILTIQDTQHHTHILCAVGTGTMLAGLIKAAGNDQELLGISVLKNHLALENEVRALLTMEESQKSFSIQHGYHFGGYAKHPIELITFMKEVWATEGLPTDIVYTSKLLYATKKMIRENYFPAGSRLLVIHSGGLQGNKSLLPGTLPF